MDPHCIHRWSDELRRRLPLTRPQADVLALWTFGVVASGTCGQTTVSQLLAQLLGRPFDTMRQRLREFYYEAQAKRGNKRRTLDVEACFPDLLRWVLSLWEGPYLPIALDATSLKQDFVVLSVSVLFGGTAIPVAWHVVRAGKPEAWQPHWLRLLERVRAVVPPDYFVLALTDRGLYAPWLFRAIQDAGWHPLMRINAQGSFTPEGGEPVPLASVAARVGTHDCARGRAFKENPLSCTLVAHWEEGYEEPWRLLTDLAPEAVEARWYGLRGWIEQGFKDFKRGGWQWQLTRMTDPDRVNRFWLVLSVATLWTVSAGAGALPPPPPGAPPAGPAASPRSAPPPTTPPATSTPRRRLSVFREGWIQALVHLLTGDFPLPGSRLLPDPWPAPFAACPAGPG
jgi:hypothetical protein